MQLQVEQDKSDKRQSKLENRVLQNEKGIKLLETNINEFKEGQKELWDEVKTGQHALMQDCIKQLVLQLGQSNETAPQEIAVLGGSKRTQEISELTRTTHLEYMDLQPRKQPF